VGLLISLIVIALKIAPIWLETRIHIGDTSKKTIIKLDQDFLELI
jgi:hypothetical protein